MPLGGGRLPPEQIALLAAWIDGGASWPDGPGDAEQARPDTGHWSLVAPKRPPHPHVRNATWVRNPIDAFIAARLEAEGIEPSPEAPRATLIRRLSLDLTGLLPTLLEVERFISGAESYGQAVDRLLDSHHFGEKQALHWLDQARIASYELAFRMQIATPELLDFSSESKATLDAYGVETESTRQFGRNCLLARRLVERGVRFIQLVHSSWDHHADLKKGIEKESLATDQPAATLIKDLKQRGLLDSTLVIWGGEFGRTPMVEDRTPSREASRGRDHHRLAFSMWMSGGGIRGGQVIGKTDELGLEVAEDAMSVNDLHATILHCLGMDHTKLTYRHQDRDFRLTDVAGNVVEKLLA